MTITVRVVREYDLTVDELYPDGLPNPPKVYGEAWPADWTPERIAAFHLSDQFNRNPFAESSFCKDFEGDCNRSYASATVTEPDLSAPTETA